MLKKIFKTLSELSFKQFILNNYNNLNKFNYKI